MILLTGTAVTLLAGLLLVTLYVAPMAALVAVGLAITNLTEHAIASPLVIAVASEVADNVS